MVHSDTQQIRDSSVSDDKEQKKTERLHMLISPAELDAIDDWRFKSRLGTRAEAVRRLVQIGLRFEEALPAIDDAASGLAQAGDSLVNRFYLRAERPPDLSDEAKKAMRAMRKVMRQAQDLVEAVASVEIQRDHLTDAGASLEVALKRADETMSLFSPKSMFRPESDE